MECYEEWDMAISPIPPRSRLYRLEPIGIGTPYVESMTSYIARLAKTHCVSPKTLITKEILPAHGVVAADPHNYDYWANGFLRKSSHSLNGLTAITKQWVETLQILTSRNDLQYLTMLKWKDSIAVEGLLRPRKAWCAACYRDLHTKGQIVYDSLLCALNDVTICLKHHQSLSILCPYCCSKQLFLVGTTNLGYCSCCSGWLGNVTDPVNRATPMLNEFEWQGWCAEALGEMLAHVPALQTAPSRDHIAIAVNDCLDRYARGNLTGLSRLLGIGTAALKGYLKKEKIPRSSSLLILSYKLNITPLDFLTMKNLVLQSTSSFLINGIQEKSHKKYQALTDDELKCAKQFLDAALDQKTYPYIKLVDIAQKIGCHVSTLKRNFPALCRIIQLRSRGQWISEEVRAMMKHELEKALTNDKRPTASAVAQSLGCDASTLRRYFPDLYHSVVARSHEAFLEAEARKHVLQKLQEIFSEGDEILSVRALAKRVGYSGDVLWRAFPDMCKQFADRRHVKLREQHLARMDKICDEIRQVMFELHRKGIYPSANKIEELMSYKCAIMTKEGYDAWKSILKELGY